MILALLLAGAAVGPVTVTATPAHPYAERDGAGVQVDGDFLVTNDGDAPLGIDELALEVRDADGHLVQRREWNSNGGAPAIRMLNTTIVPAHGSVLLFNPLPKVAAGVPMASLKVIVALSRTGVDERLEAATSFVPRADDGPAFRFPLKGRVLVWDGHDLAAHHRRWDYSHPMLKGAGYTSNAARYALDLIHVDAEGRRATGDEQVNENWLSFGQPVFAEAAGTVVAIKAGQPDDRHFDPRTAVIPNALYGNYVVIAHGDGSHSIYGHLKKDSVKVVPGQAVAAGEEIAAIGASGSALFPHLHVQRMDGPTDRGEGIPTRFDGVTRPGGAALADGYVDSGDVVVAD